MDADIYNLVAKYGFKNLHMRLEELMREEYAYFQTKFHVEPPIVPIAPVVPIVVKQVQGKQKKQRKPYTKRATLEQNEVSEVPEVSEINEEQEVETKEVVVTEKAFRDPKEMKEFQKAAVEAKRKENEAAGFQPSDFLTKDNLKQWIEVEGQTYSWVAREKAGCPDTQVSATAQMMGIKSRISKKMGRTMTRN